MDREISTLLKMSCDDEFFKNLEKYLDCVIPIHIKNILKLNGYNSASSLIEFDDDSIPEIENYMRSNFTSDMLDNKETVTDYYGKFSKVPNHFSIVGGEKRLILKLVETCRSLYTLRTPVQSSNNDSFSHDPIHRSNLFNIIGCHMITIFNDAKRTSLSGWSWPSRVVATELGNNFKLTGSTSGDINLQYVNPINHAVFLNCIVKSDLQKVGLTLQESLAVSLRVDGSVDRTQAHNVYIMAHIVRRDASIVTLFISFGVPKQGGAAGYLQCLRDATKIVMPWQQLFRLISSIVTDGEGLNMGRFNGLCARLRQERLNDTATRLPLLSLWCISHRVNLAWKAVCKLNIVASIIARSSNLSSYFHKSGSRTTKLKLAATVNNLSEPLRYPQYFAIRWTEFVFNLLNVILRNWRVSIKYFESENLSVVAQRWLLFDNVHLITFLTDVLGLAKAYQKTCQSDSISLLEALDKGDALIEKLESCKHSAIDGGWERFFLDSVVLQDNKIFLCGIEMTKTPPRLTRRQPTSFSVEKRKLIVTTFIKHLKIRLGLDNPLRSALKPLSPIISMMSQLDLSICHSTIIPDMDKAVFYSEYNVAAELLKDHQCKTPLASLQKLQELKPDTLPTIKYALARLVALKPHSADVERLINVYNKFKESDRSSLSPGTLFNYLYVNANMGCVEDFDPTGAVQYWLDEQRRRPKISDKQHQQEWFKGVFKDAKRVDDGVPSNKIQF